jgi:hypothetical protein
LKQAQTTTITLWFTVALQFLRGEREAAAATAARLGALADAHGFAHWADIAGVMSHAVDGARTDRATLAQMHERLMRLPRTAAWRRVVCLCLLAERCLDAGCPEEGRRVLASISDDHRLAILAPEIQRLEGELLLRGANPAADEAERAFRAAIDLARRREEKSLQLRATTSLARLWRQQGRRDEARPMLAGIYGWFTEGFDTADLTDARTLLEELS